MVLIQNSVLLDCSPERAFDYLSDLGNEAEWNPDMDHIEKLTDGPVGVRTKWRAKWEERAEAPSKWRCWSTTGPAGG